MPEDTTPTSAAPPTADDPDAHWAGIVDAALEKIRLHLDDATGEARRELEAAMLAVTERESSLSGEHDDLATRSREIYEATAQLAERVRACTEREELAAAKATRAAQAMTLAAKQLADAKVEAAELLAETERRCAERELEAENRVHDVEAMAEQQAADIVAAAHAASARTRAELRRLVALVQGYLANPDRMEQPAFMEELDLRDEAPPAATESAEPEGEPVGEETADDEIFAAAATAAVTATDTDTTTAESVSAPTSTEPAADDSTAPTAADHPNGDEAPTPKWIADAVRAAADGWSSRRHRDD